MSTSVNIRIKIVSLTAKSEPPAFVQRKLEAELGKNVPKKNCIIATFQHFCRTNMVESRERSGRFSRITEKIDEVHHVTEN